MLINVVGIFLLVMLFGGLAGVFELRGCRVAMLCIVLGTIGVYATYKFFYPTYTWHQRLTVEVETPAGIASGSSVTSVSHIFQPLLLPDIKSYLTDVTGEATVVKLPQSRYLFALLPGTETRALRAFNLYLGEPREQAPSLMAREGETVVLQPDLYPLLVTFDNLNDPASVKRVDPFALEAAFGSGYRLASVTLTITDEPVTHGPVESLLRWLGKYPEPRLSPPTGRIRDIPFSRRVSHGDFIRR
ncbi:hypothetical protein LXM94_03465 [Rhizobium sp. TRM95111]|uniref:hypothetical protein n=1 Tax=Rhizobium alarense TaxID=2846851 RepID=UPI001F2945F7|nr:hypothetical protein [Rhizobium alarense]MCF3639022.1 hypothetical protein [Rhizobium alarense]